jgi:hypothetical protein
MTSSAHLQREADAARVGLADTLGQLRDGVAPSALSGEAIALVKDSGLSILKSLADSARANPVPALLIGAGLTMLLTRTTGSDVMGVATSTLKSAASSGVTPAPELPPCGLPAAELPPRGIMGEPPAPAPPLIVLPPPEVCVPPVVNAPPDGFPPDPIPALEPSLPQP